MSFLKTHFTHEKSPDRLDRVLAQTLPELSRNRARSLILEGRVRVDDVAVTAPAFMVKPGNCLEVIFPPPVCDHPIPQPIKIDIIYEDDDLIVVDKPAGLVVHPAAGNPDHTLVNALLAHCGESLSGIGGVRRPGIVHRLDKGTSGLMVVAKNDPTHRHLAKQFAARRIDRAYHALVWGRPEPACATIKGGIGRHAGNRKKMAVYQDKGKPARTDYTTKAYYPDPGQAGLAASLLECRLKTGRTHQIRVHLSHIGYPVIGDPVYGKKTAMVKVSPQNSLGWLRNMINRQALHAVTLGFIHPSSETVLRFHSPLPADMETLIDALKNRK